MIDLPLELQKFKDSLEGGFRLYNIVFVIFRCPSLRAV
jgi:hypothetical protein